MNALPLADGTLSPDFGTTVMLAAVLVLGVYVYAGVIVARWTWHRLRPKAAPAKHLSRPWRWVHAVVVAAAGAMTACLLWAWQVEPYWPEITHVRVPTAKLPKSVQPIRIVQISDTHCDTSVRLENRLPEIIAGLKPDIIVFTGDAANVGGEENFRRLISRLAAVAPTYGVLGNWDLWRGQPDILKDTGVRELDGEAVRLHVRGQELWLAGAPFLQPSELAIAMRGVPRDALCVGLFHTPDIAPYMAERRPVDLLLCGHTHGGQICLPFYGAVLTCSQYGKTFESGLKRAGTMPVYINRGIGMEGGHTPRLRFLCRPEVTLIELTPD